MWNGLFLLIAPICVFALAALLVYFWDRTASPLWQEENTSEDKPSSWAALRSIQHILWILLVISVMAYFFPFLLSLKDKMRAQGLQAKWFILSLAAVFPATLLLLLVYGSNRKYLEWIADLNWPHRKEEKGSNGSPAKID